MIIVTNNRSNYNDEVHQEAVAVERDRPVANKWIGMRLDDPALDLVNLARAQGVEAEGLTSAEALLAAYAGSYKMRACALRLTNVYGTGMSHKDSFVARLMRAARSGSHVQIYGDGAQRRDFVYVDDVAAATVLAWSESWTGCVIIGSGHSVTVLDLVDRVRRVTGRSIDIEHVPPRRGEMDAVIVDISRARQLGFEPSLGLDEGLAKVWGEAESRWTVDPAK